MLGTAGHCYAMFCHDLVKAIAFIDEAIDINPNLAQAFFQSGTFRAFAGDFELAILHLERALRLSPRDARAYTFHQGMAFALLLSGNAKTAREWALRGVQHNANYAPGWWVLAASSAALGNKAEAEKAVQHSLALDPAFSISGFVRKYPTGGPNVLQPLVRGLRMAGVPE